MLSVINLTDSQETEDQTQRHPLNPLCSKLHGQSPVKCPSSDPGMMEVDLMDDDQMAVENLAENPESSLGSELADIPGQEPTNEGIFLFV